MKQLFTRPLDVRGVKCHEGTRGRKNCDKLAVVQVGQTDLWIDGSVLWTQDLCREHADVALTVRRWV